MNLEWNSVKENLLKELDNQQDYVLPGLTNFRKVLIPMIRRIIPGMIAHDLVGVQPMVSFGPMFNSFVPENFAMMNIRQRSVNVSRTELLAKLKENLEIHKREYEEALVACHTKLIEDLVRTTKNVEKMTDPRKLKNFRFQFAFPQNHTQEYIDVIEMLEMSIDENINLDSESFKAYIKNEWSWSGQFNTSKALYESVGSAFSNSDDL